MSKFTFYADVLVAIAKKKQTAIELAEASGYCRVHIRQLLRRMRDLGLIHIDHWKPQSVRNVMSPVWAFGKGVDAPLPLTKSGRVTQRDPEAAGRLQPRIELVTFANLVKAMVEPQTCLSLANVAGTDRNWTYRVLNHMHAIKLVHIAEWETRSRGGQPSAMFQIGSKADAPRPRPMGAKEASRRRSQQRQQRKQMLRIVHALAANASIFSQAQAA